MTVTSRRLKASTPPISQGAAARVLRVSREHLNRVINGKWKNPRLLAEYKLLIHVASTKTKEKSNEKTP